MYRFEYLTQREGLSQGTVNCIIQDKKGFMWFGTQDGLNRYDGNGFIVYRNDPKNPESLSQNWVQAITEAEAGVLWIGTNGGGLNRFDTGTLKNLHFSPQRGDSDCLSNGRVNALCVDAEERLWIGTDNGLDMLDLRRFKVGEKARFSHWRHNPADSNSLSDNAVTSLYSDPRGVLWVGTQNGLNRLEKSGHYFTRFFCDPRNDNSLIDNQISEISGDREGNLWIGALNAGACRYMYSSGSFQRFRSLWGEQDSLCSDLVSSIIVDHEGYIWIGTGNLTTSGSGVTRLFYDEKTAGWEYVHFNYSEDGQAFDSGGLSEYLNDKTIISLCTDRSGGIWFGGFQGGINKLSKRRVKFRHYYHKANEPNSLSSNSVLSFHQEENGVLWVGTYWSGLDRWDRVANRFINYRHKRGDKNSLGGNAVWTIYGDRKKTLWIGLGSGGIDRFNPASGTFTHFTKTPGNSHDLRNDSVTRLLEDNVGNFWVGTWRGGIHQLNRETGTYIPNPLPRGVLDGDEGMTDIYQDNRLDLWFCTYGKGLYHKPVISPEINIYKHNPLKNSPSGDYLLCIREDGNGDLWIGSNSGLMKLNRDNMEFENFSVADGLPSNMVHGIIPYGEYLWLSTNNGISRFHYGARNFRNFGIGEGAQGLEFNQGAFLMGVTGEIFMGGTNGLNIFHPRDIVENTHPPEIVLSRFLKFNRPVSFDRSISMLSSIELSYLDRFITFEFSALDFENPAKNRYAYKLEGFDDNWIECDTRRSASYTNLDGGKYVFRVRGCNSDGIWNMKGVALNVHITPPFWERWWFRLALLVLVLGLFLGVHRFRMRDLRHKTRHEQLERELFLKAQFTAMLVHDLKNPLQSIRGYAELIEIKPDTDKLGKYISHIKYSSDAMLNLIRDMLDLSKFEAGKMNIIRKQILLEDLIHRNIELIHPLALRKQIRVDLELENLSQLWIDPLRIAQVINNFLSNALKFSPPGGIILVSARSLTEGGRVFQEVAVSDDGPGIPPAHISGLFSVYGQLEGQSSASADGTGLGLAVSRLIIEAHEGSIGYRPREKGSIFYFILPG